jgi:hypothetical protein
MQPPNFRPQIEEKDNRDLDDRSISQNCLNCVFCSQKTNYGSFGIESYICNCIKYNYKVNELSADKSTSYDWKRFGCCNYFYFGICDSYQQSVKSQSVKWYKDPCLWIIFFPFMIIFAPFVYLMDSD